MEAKEAVKIVRAVMKKGSNVGQIKEFAAFVGPKGMAFDSHFIATLKRAGCEICPTDEVKALEKSVANEDGEPDYAEPTKS